MKSPFPGMDPYLERRWRDIHTTMITHSRDRLNKSLPPDLVARSEDRVYVEADGDRVRGVHPDVRIIEQPAVLTAAPSETGVAVAQPVLLELESEPVTERFIQIIEIDSERVVTAIEFISPTNKEPGDGRDAYLKKRREFPDSDVNLVEVDLVRRGDWIDLMRPFRVPQVYRTTYRAFVRRADRREQAELYPITIRQPLPIIAIPLRQGDPPVQFNIQELLQSAYESGRYESTDYRRECDPPLGGEDAVWADRLLRDAGRR